VDIAVSIEKANIGIGTSEIAICVAKALWQCVRN
jgi:hypothetical protein